MAPVNDAVVIDATDSDVLLAEQAAGLLLKLQPRKAPQRIVEELLQRLRAEKGARETAGANHWNEHAPRFLAGMVRQARRERARRYREAEAFYRTKRREVLRFAIAILGNAAAAEVAAAETYRELLEGQVSAANFFMALTANARNYLARQAFQRDTFVPIEDAFAPNHAGSGDQEGEEQGPAFEPLSHRGEDQDPLDILIARDESEQRSRQLDQAKRIAQTDWRYCWIGQKKWGRKLGIVTAREPKS